VTYFEHEIIVCLLQIPEEYLAYFVQKYNQISKSNLDKIIDFFTTQFNQKFYQALKATNSEDNFLTS